MRIMGLDVGSKTVGVAISDPLGFTAQGLESSKSMKIKVSLALIESRNWLIAIRWSALLLVYQKT